MIIYNLVYLNIQPDYTITITPPLFADNQLPDPFSISFYGSDHLFTLSFKQIDDNNMAVEFTLGSFYLGSDLVLDIKSIPITGHHFYIKCEDGYIKVLIGNTEWLFAPVLKHDTLTKIELDAEYGFMFVDVTPSPKPIDLTLLIGLAVILSLLHA